ncbi:splicing factor, Prp19-binding domain-containing protein [Annulohypoxylon truncatum]|uniref:splicing factor, Prp19-binding domain-containing protein n=1 Tax=Annulohypoxylon truncatum TaxID=327061 RepID=UPI002008055F|nr:splicing factor, Prp19-binding domain-containing protein [Annulohypoxylon truncatum]KAI1214526.1 splicing factor, Prp19-binding domain-containing protein [Annulohypoxylon truncatum]
MPPPTKSKRMTANPARPTRYRAGKATGVSSSESESEASEAEAEQQQQIKRKIAPPPKAPSAGKIISNLSRVNLDERRKQDQEAEIKRVEAVKAARLAAEEGFVTEESEDEDDSEEGSGEDESEEEESSEEEAPRRLMLKPKFVPKNQRNKASIQEQDEAAKLAEEEAKRKKAMDDMVEEQMRKDAAARATRKGHWNDNVEDEEDVDTEDDVEPEAEYAAWKVRELKRIKREREAIEAREKEREEVERRRNLTEEERKAEDDAFLAKQKDEKDSKGKMSYMQKYFHKGAFYRDEAEAEGLANRDIMGTRIMDDVKNRDLLPKALQMRDMTKLGKKGASKYKDLKSEDTGQWGNFRDTRPGKDFDRYNVDDRFKSDYGRDNSGPGGANAIPLGERKKPVSDAPQGPRNFERRRDHDRDSYRPRDDHRDRDRPDRDSYSSRRKRDSSRDADRYESDKRRKTDTR